MSGLDAAAAGVVALAAKATLVLGLALLVAWLARRGSARTLHLLWTTAFVLLLALPVLSVRGPSWSVPILPAGGIETKGLSPETTPDSPATAGLPREMSGPLSPSGAPRNTGDHLPPPPSGSEAAAGSLTIESSLPQPGTGEVPVPLTPSAIAFLIWAVGCGAALTSLVVGGIRFRKLVHEAAPVRDPGWLRRADAIRRRLRVRSQVRIVMSPEAATPMAGGALRPVILLPASAEAWSPERRAVVLAHELVHIRRRDALRQVAGRAVVALYWFHPLSWLAWRAATIAGERSCDEEVLALGTRPSEYARHLFSLASETAGGPNALALPMVQRAQLEHRIMAILKQHRPRYSLVRTIAALAAIGAAGALIACANPVPRDLDAQPAAGVEMTVSSGAQAQDHAIPAPSSQPLIPANPVPEPASPGNEPTEPDDEPTAPENAIGEPETASPSMSDPAPASTPESELQPEQGPMPEPAPVAPEVARAAGHQAFECNPGNGVTIRRREGEWTLQHRVDGMRLCMRTHGNIEMAADGIAVESMDDDSWVVLESQAERLHRLVITPGPGGPEYDWSIEGRPEVFDDEAVEWRDLMLTVLDGYEDVQQVLAEESSLRGEIAAHRGHVFALRGRISTHRGHVSALRGEISTHRGHVARLRGEIAAHRGHVSVMRGQINSPRAQVARVMSQLSAQMELIVHQHAMTTLADRMREAVETAREAWATSEAREALESARQALARVDALEAIETARQASGTSDMADAASEAVRAMAEALETPEMQETMASLAELSETFSATADDWTTLADDLQQIERDLAARRTELLQEAAALQREAVREIEEEIQEYDLAGRVAAIEARIEEYDLDGKVRAIEAQIDEYDLDGRIAEIEAQIEEYDLNGKIRELEARIEEFDADRRVSDIERSLQDEIAALRRIIG